VGVGDAERARLAIQAPAAHRAVAAGGDDDRPGPIPEALLVPTIGLRI